MQITIDLWVLVAVLILAAVAIFLTAILIEVVRRRRNRVILEPLIGVVLPQAKKRRSTYIAPQRWSHQKGRHAK